MKKVKELDSIIDILSSQNLNVTFYFIQRKPKKGLKEKTIDKYDYFPIKADLSNEINLFFKDSLLESLKNLSNNGKYNIINYQIINDDLSGIISKLKEDKNLSFHKTIELLMNKKTEHMKSLSDVKKNLWAYAIEFNDNKNSFLCFRKSTSSKIATDDKNLREKLSSYWDSADGELKISPNETVSFDSRIDCLFFGDTYYILNKSNFEILVGMENQFLEFAKEVIETLTNTGLIEGIALLEKEIKENKNILKTVSNIGKKGTQTTLDSHEITKMKQVLQQMEQKELKLSPSNKIVLENTDDVNSFLKLLNDYYKQGLVTGKIYGSHSGEIIP
ncbi:Kiwa anti-phage protein KwaB-like domain-containing protein [Leptospira terpstrae]|uniref:DUF4868 domain-containing protein n=1 Tax=Leptospira terpstrae serovar Hualin str. LT 11-33 = ATCC 700639 TaxID=1257025 RepID=N1VSL7_9LEPT|nr:Kiwa anti-phage protein KwaB-like domain-containing protein [Leptospira terpstrae]EMY61428.1 hypothetical protein LEP1GSC203_1103 [Leptospira terpstrae serovar Hualin str. LT 11-33 = ATCC 700639]